MAGSFFGADVDQLRQLSRSLAQNAEQIQAITTRLSPRIDSTGWRGPDADRFRGGWNEELAPSLRAATRALEDASGLAETNARQQEQASGGGSGLGGSGIAGGGAAVRPSPDSDYVPTMPEIAPSFFWDATRDALKSRMPITGWRYGDVAGYIPVVSDVLTARSIGDSIQQGEVPIFELIGMRAGELAAVGAKAKNPVMYLTGAAIGTWSTVIEIATESDFSAQTRATTWDYVRKDPSGAVAAAATAVVQDLPRIFSGLKFW